LSKAEIVDSGNGFGEIIPININLDHIDAKKRELYGLLAGSLFDLEGFEAFFRLIFPFELAPHLVKPTKAAFKAFRMGKGFIWECFRGAAKTTTATIGLTAFCIGHEPTLSVLLVQVGDDIAKDNSKQIADIIENSPGWKEAFPHIVPDFKFGWGAGGYQIMQTHTDRTLEEPLSRPAWRAMNAQRKDPSLLGVGYKSHAIIGKRPTGLLLLDDIHDENNTRSDRELETVKKLYTGTILPTLAPECKTGIVGTPWNKRDIIATESATGNYLHIKVPVIEKKGEIRYSCPICNTENFQPTLPETEKEWNASPDGFCVEGHPVVIEDTNVYAWPERYNRTELAARKRSSGKIEYARMYLLDLSAAANTIFSYFPFPYEKLDPTWRMVGGVDYAGTASESQNLSGKNDYFAMAYVAVNENNVAVVYDGVRERVTQGRGEKIVSRAQGLFPGWQHSVIEGDGKGEDFIQFVMRNPGMRIVPMKTGGKSKSERLEKQMGPWLESGRVRISNAETPFLNALRAELDDYPNNDYDDCMDAVYWALRGIPDVLYTPSQQTELNTFYKFGEKPESDNPYRGLF